MRCPICDAPVRSSDQFCERCGAALTHDEPNRTELFELPRSQQTEQSRRRSRKRGVRWYNRWSVRILVLLLLLIAGAATYAWKQVDDTMGDLNAISTLPAQIQDQTAQDVSGTPIANLPTVVPPPTQTGPAPTIVIPNYAGVSPGGPVRQTAVALAHQASPAVGTPATPIAGESAPGEVIPPGMTFDTGPAQTALAEAENLKTAPTPTPSGSSYLIEHSDGSLQSTPPANQSDSDGDGGIIGGLQDAANGAAVASGLKDPKTEPMTILIMGVDARPGAAIDIGVRPDALMVLRLDPATGACKGLAIPRDSLAELPGYGETKINHALMLGGIPYEELVVELYLGIDIDHYALIDFTGFEDLVDAVGGITITVPENLASPAVPAGTHTIDGETALRHARYRGGPDGDFGRIQRQQEIMRALIASAGGKDLLTEANRLLPPLQDHVRTDLSLEQLVSLARYYQSNCSATGMTLDTIPGEVVYGPIIDPLFGLPLSYVVSDPKDVQTKVDELMEDDPQ
ncbi:MAG TPA: LCP family protein [Thermomicrobiales bacterium]|nr:LCP family protein [Thermomicrobiales bacterium]